MNKKWLGLLLTLCLLLANATGMAQSYAATVDGHNGPLSVEVVYAGGKIAGVTVTAHAETAGIADGALERMPKAIVDAQSLNVDTVAGATVTSKAILAAVEACVAQAGGDVQALKAAQAVAYEKTLTAGTYRAAAHGHHSDVVVDVTVTENAIVSVTVVEEGETYNIGEAAFGVIPAAIVEHQSIGVDMVAGATYTSQAIVNAVADALRQAGGENAVMAFGVKVEAEPWSEEEITADYDVVVVGSGLSGVSAAIAAQDGGAKVALLEKLPYFGGVSQTSAGAAVYPGDAGKNAQGVIDYLLYRNVGHIQGNMNTENAWISEACVRALAENAYADVKWLEEKGLAMMWIDAAALKHFGMEDEQGKIQNKTDLQGVALMLQNGTAAPDVAAHAIEKLVTDFVAKGGALYLETPATSLITDANGAVTGVKAEGRNGKYTFNAKAVCLCAGGFGASKEMIEKYAPAYIGEVNTTLVGNTGDGIRMAEEIGAAVYEDAYMMGGSAQTIVTDRDMISPYADAETPMTALYVSPQGLRLNSENPEAYSNSAMHINPDSRDYYWVIINEEVASQNEAYKAILDEQLAAGNERFFKADTVAELAKKMKMVPSMLNYTIDNYNLLCEKGEDTDLFKEPQYLVAMKNGPWYAVKAYMQYFGTVGGLVPNEKTEVLDTEGNVISGLYAAGENSNHGVFQLCYSGGLSVTECITFGRIAGQQAAAKAAQ